MPRDEQGIRVSADRYRIIPRTLCFVCDGDDVLLLKGAPNKRLWANRYNGVGGHVERGEDVCSAALREICEETGWQAGDIADMQLRGLIHIDAGDPQTGIMLFLFTATALRRDTAASEEGTLEWISRQKLMEYDLVEDLTVLLPRVLALTTDDPTLFGRYSYGPDDKLLISISDCHLPGML
jgi:8-oxo-dGTP diphosphatase